MDVELYKSTLQQFLNELPINSNVIDLGCGPGNITHYLLQQRPDIAVLGIDIAPDMIALAEKNNPSANFKVMNALNITSINTQYNGIVCAFLLPYLSKVHAIELIKTMAKLLMPNGVLYLSTMEDLNSNSKYQSSSYDTKDRLFINYHEKSYLTDTIQDCGLTLLSTTQQEYTHKNGTTTTEVIIIAKK